METLTKIQMESVKLAQQLLPPVTLVKDIVIIALFVHLPFVKLTHPALSL
jgi:hypothetical protein